VTTQLTIDEAIAQRNGVLNLIAGDPMKSPSVREVADAIARTCEIGDRVSANSIREHLPTWINRFAIGAAFGALIKAGALEPLATVISTDRGTHGKRVGLYVVTADALEAVS
jgi:hypothetical protein